MSSYTTNEIRGGMKLLIDGDPYAVIENEYVKPGKGQAFNRIRVRNLRTGRTVEKSYRSGESIEAADVMDTEMQYLYKDGDFWTFMNPENYEQLQAGESAVGEAAQWLKDELRIEHLTLLPGDIEGRLNMSGRVVPSGELVHGEIDARWEDVVLPGGDQDLGAHQIEAGHHLGDRVLDLEAGVHLHEPDVAAGVHVIDDQDATIIQRACVLDADHAIRPLRHRRARHDADGLAFAHAPRGEAACRHGLDDTQRNRRIAPRAPHVDGPDRVAIHAAVVPRRMVDR